MKVIKFKKPAPPDRMTLEEFAQEYELTLVVNERTDGDIQWINSHGGKGERFYAYFQTFDLVVREGVLEGVSGEGDSEQEAMADLASQISGGKAKYGLLYIDIPQLYV